MGEEGQMHQWGPTLYGDPCHGCGFGWGITQIEGIEVITALPRSIAELTTGVGGAERHPDLEWSMAEYVCHVGDNLRIWAERLMGVVGGAGPTVGAYDQDALARARGYRSVPLTAALWSLSRSVDDWVHAVAAGHAADVALVHSELGSLRLVDLVRMNAHDAVHHRWDIQRTVADR
jgi:hypothetical protein